MIRKMIATALVATALAAPASADDVYQLSGLITDAEALTFAVINGNPLSVNPEPGDLPLGYTAELRVPAGSGSAEIDFEFGGSFTSPSRSYNFDVELLGLPVDVTANSTLLLQIDDSSTAIDTTTFSLTLDKTTGMGSWEWFESDGVPTVPPGDRSATATITSATLIPEIPEPAAAVLCVLAGVPLAWRTR